MKKTNWIYANASVIGNSHITHNVPCQDASKVGVFDNFLIAVVSDGAGSCKNSELGSEAVCNFSIKQFSELVEKNKWFLKEKYPSEKEWDTISKQELKKIKEQLKQLSQDEEELEFNTLACTLIVVIAFNDRLLVTHIGDGRAGYCDNNDNWHSMISPFQGDQPNETVFITSEIWSDDKINYYIESRIIKNTVKAFCLLSDGCEKAAFECNLYDKETEKYYDPNLPYKEFFHKNINLHLPNLFKSKKSQKEVNEHWNEFLKSGNPTLARESDDKTMILVVRN
jgi:serine/threonine protein phosphatase PrpC